MGKRRSKEKGTSPKMDNSADLTGARCMHIRKGIDSSWLKKTSLDKSWDTCESCQREKGSESGDTQETPAVWVCLNCGHRGCGRFSKNQHAIKHYETLLSDPHCLVLSLDDWSVWCYICNDNTRYSSTGQLSQLIANIQKQMLGENRHKLAARKNTLSEVTVEKEEEKNEEQKEDKTTVKENIQESASCIVPVRGLTNLGNTCFFNAVLQNLSQTWLLRELLNDFSDKEKTVLITPSSSSGLEPLQVQLQRPGALTLAMCQLLNEIQVAKKGTVMPQELYKQVCKKTERFKGYQQQDSHELLRYLLDGMRSEENIRLTAGIHNVLKISGKPSEPDQKKLVKEYESNGVTKSFVERVFGGELTNTLMCMECKTVSVVTEVFLDLSLSVIDEANRKTKNGFAYNQPQKSESVKSRRSFEATPTSGNEDLPTGSGSKYQQKKAKKQARKRAKSQRYQQKQDAKSTADLLANQSKDASPETPPPSTDSEDDAEEIISLSEPTKQNQVEDDGEVQNSTFKRFINLSEEEEDENKKTVLTMSVGELTLSENQQSKEVESGAESEMDLGAESGFVVVNTDPKAAFSSLSSRSALNSLDCSLEASLYQFTQVEPLNHTNSLLCMTCSQRASQGGRKKVYTEGMKQMLISFPPLVLTLHLKRFQQLSYSTSKVNKHVKFPQVLDLGPFCSAKCKAVEEGQTQLLYSLYGIVEHSGTMRSGHYTAFVKARPKIRTSRGLLNEATGVKVPPKGSWYHISDISVHLVTEAQVQASQAYLLFYESIS